MDAVRFVHAADLHLDAPFRGISREAPPELAACLRDATFTALKRLVELCERERPDFLVLAGDVYNQEDRSLRAQLALHDACRRLEDVGVAVFVAHGNHDPFPSRLKALRRPGNVIVFGEEPETHAVRRNGETVALVHGVSHSSGRETRNLAARFRRAEADCLQVGVLHTSCGGADGETRYAPCMPDDLAATDLDYWALGHVHEQRAVLERPPAVYPGCAQGLHVNEQGEKGCLSVVARREDGTWLSTVSFHALGPVIWRILEIRPRPSGEEGGVRTLDELETLIRRQVEAEAAQLWPGCEALILRIRLEGRTVLDAELRRPGVLADFTDRLREGSPSGPLVWIKDVDLRTRSEADRDRLRAREDLLGEILRLADRCRSDPDMLRDTVAFALRDLYEHARARKALEPLELAECERLMEEAEALCLDLLEND